MNMKNLTNDQVAAQWSKLVMDGAGESSNGFFSYDDVRLISYKTTIANVIKGRADCYVVLITSEHFSSSTAAHISLARRNTTQPMFVVPHVGVRDGRSSTPYTRPCETMHRSNLMYLVQTYREYLDMLMRKRSVSAYHYDTLQSMAMHANEYALFFDLDAPCLPWKLDTDKVSAKFTKPISMKKAA
jgi:hypothetical protein